MMIWLRYPGMLRLFFLSLIILDALILVGGRGGGGGGGRGSTGGGGGGRFRGGGGRFRGGGGGMHPAHRNMSSTNSITWLCYFICNLVAFFCLFQMVRL